MNLMATAKKAVKKAVKRAKKATKKTVVKGSQEWLAAKAAARRKLDGLE